MKGELFPNKLTLQKLLKNDVLVLRRVRLADYDQQVAASQRTGRPNRQVQRRGPVGWHSNLAQRRILPNVASFIPRCRRRGSPIGIHSTFIPHGIHRMERIFFFPGEKFNFY